MTSKTEFKPKDRFYWTKEEQAEGRRVAKARGINYLDLVSEIVDLQNITGAEYDKAMFEADARAKARPGTTLEEDMELALEAEREAATMTPDEYIALMNQRFNEGV